MAVSAELSVLRAIAASGRRSRSKRPTSSAEKCCASAAEPPLPHTNILLLLISALNKSSTPLANNGDKRCALTLKESVAASKCEIMREVISISGIISWQRLEDHTSRFYVWLSCLSVSKHFVA